VAEGCARKLLGIPAPSSAVGDGSEREPGGVIARAPLRASQYEQHLAALRLVIVRKQGDRLFVVLDGLFVGEQLRGAVARGNRVSPRGPGPSEVTGQQEVMGQLGWVDALVLSHALERFCYAVMQANAAADAELAVEHLAHEGVREGEYVDAVCRFNHESGRHAFFQRAHDLLGGFTDDLCDDPEPKVAADDGRGGEHFRRQRGKMAHAPPNDLRHTLWHAEPLQSSLGNRLFRGQSAVDQSANRLFNKKDVAFGLLAQAPNEIWGDVAS
jgi:hypothetical protein